MGIWIFGSTNLILRPHENWKRRQIVTAKKKKKKSNRANPALCDTPEKANEEFEVIVEDEYDSISLDGIWHFFVSVHPFFFVDITSTYFCGR